MKMDTNLKEKIKRRENRLRMFSGQRLGKGQAKQEKARQTT
jgi:hypothetical protein